LSFRDRAEKRREFGAQRVVDFGHRRRTSKIGE
jgi:hypothetical protein